MCRLGVNVRIMFDYDSAAVWHSCVSPAGRECRRISEFHTFNGALNTSRRPNLFCSFFHGVEQVMKRAVGGLNLVRAREDTPAWKGSHNTQIRFFRLVFRVRTTLVLRGLEVGLGKKKELYSVRIIFHLQITNSRTVWLFWFWVNIALKN